MDSFETYNWAAGTPEEHLAVLHGATDAQLCRLARSYDWRLYPEPVLGWMMAQRAIDLGSALTCFFNGEPERFNYLAKRDVPEQHRAAARLLDNICLRVNSGFYLACSRTEVGQQKRMQNWLTYQNADRRERRRGRWILDERILDTLDPEARALSSVAAADVQTQARPSLMRRVLGPLSDLGINRSNTDYATTKD